MLYLAIYYLVGVITIYGAALVHLIRAEWEGYEAIKYWDEHQLLLSHDDLPAMLVGMTVWPVKLIRFLRETDYYYSLYDTKRD